MEPRHYAVDKSGSRWYGALSNRMLQWSHGITPWISAHLLPASRPVVQASMEPRHYAVDKLNRCQILPIPKPRFNGATALRRG